LPSDHPDGEAREALVLNLFVDLRFKFGAQSRKRIRDLG
jgi:hypothetical protein